MNRYLNLIRKKLLGYFRFFPISHTSQKQTLHIDSDELPHENVFWALTVYEMQGNLFASKSFNRYLINPHMEPQLKRDNEGGVTFYIQHHYPGRKKAANWLPAPKGNFWMSLKLYRPGEGAVEYNWPELRAVKS